MAITGSNLTTGFAENSTTAGPTASISPTANRLIILTVGALIGSGTINTPTITTTLGVTFVLVNSTGSGQTRRSFVFRAMSASPGTGTITATFDATMSRIIWEVSEFSGVDTSGANGAGAIAQTDAYGAAALSTSRTVNLQGFRDTTNNAAFASWLVGAPQSETINAEGTWTKISQSSGGANLGNVMHQYFVGEDTTSSASWTTNSHSNIVVIEIRASSTATPGPVFRNDLTNNTAASNNTFTTANISVTANRLVLLAVQNTRGAGAELPSSFGGTLSATWTQVATVTYNTVGTPTSRLTLFRTMLSSSASGTITVNFTSSHTRLVWLVTELGGVNAISSDGSRAITANSATNHADASTSLTVTLNAFADGRNATYGVFASDTGNGGSFASGAGFVEINHNNGGSGGSIFGEFRYTNDTTADASTTSSDLAGIAVEIAATALASPMTNQII